MEPTPKMKTIGGLAKALSKNFIAVKNACIFLETIQMIRITSGDKVTTVEVPNEQRVNAKVIIRNARNKGYIPDPQDRIQNVEQGEEP